MAAIPSYRAEMLGLSERDRTLLRSLLAASQARTGVRWDGDAGQPAVYFIDIDGQAGAEFWQSLGDGDRLNAAIVLAATQPAGTTRWLPKPLRSASLIGVLEKMTLPARPPTTPPSAATPAAATAPARARDPNAPLRLLDVLEGAAGPGARVVQSPHWPDLVLGNGNSHAMRTAPLDSYVDGFAASIEISNVARYSGGPMSDELRIDIDTLRWLALLYAPISEISVRLPYPQRARLLKLPAFGQLPHKIQHVRMAAWLVQHPATPQELADMINVDEECVQRFLGACHALGLMQEIAAAPEPVAAAAPAIVAAAPAVPAVAPAVEPEPAIEPAPIAEPAAVAEAASITEATPEPPAAADAGESISVIERLRLTREQNRARVAAAIRRVSGH